MLLNLLLGLPRVLLAMARRADVPLPAEVRRFPRWVPALGVAFRVGRRG